MSLKSIELLPTDVKNFSIDLPGSKSISNRVLLLSSLSEGLTNISNLLFSEDTQIMIDALKKLGINIIESKNNNECKVMGKKNSFITKEADIYVGNAGTVIRPLTASLAFNDGDYKLYGSKRMHERPIKDLVDSLNSIGSKIQYLEKNGFPPIKITKSKIQKNLIKIKGNISSQFLTSILIASPFFSYDEKFIIDVVGDLISKPYIDITLNLMKMFGVNVINKNYTQFQILPGQYYTSPNNVLVEGDASSATYFLAAGAISGKTIRVNGLGNNSIQGDIGFVKILEKMGAIVNKTQNWIEVSSNSQLKAIDVDLNDIPDAAMTIAILALYAKGTTKIRNIGSWRVKETDRLYAMNKELRKLGAKTEEGEDYLVIEPNNPLSHASIDTYNDHRMAMCFSLASLNSQYIKGAKIKINDPNCVSKTFPNYFEIFNKIKL